MNIFPTTTAAATIATLTTTLKTIYFSPFQQTKEKQKYHLILSLISKHDVLTSSENLHCNVNWCMTLYYKQWKNMMRKIDINSVLGHLKDFLNRESDSISNWPLPILMWNLIMIDIPKCHICQHTKCTFSPKLMWKIGVCILHGDFWTHPRQLRLW